MRKPESSYVQTEMPVAQPGADTATPTVAPRVAPPVPTHKEAHETPVAVIVCHGMGQQVPFETIDHVARIFRGNEASSVESKSRVRTRVVAGGDSYLPRAEIDIVSATGKRRAVHVYEIYWAPLTEGRVNLIDVHRFLVNAGWSGIQRSFSKMYRWMFDDWQELPIGRMMVVKFVVALLVFWALTLMSTTIVAIAAAKTVLRAPSPWPSDALLADLTMDLLLFAVVVGALVLILFLAKWLHSLHPAGMATKVANVVGWYTVILTIFVAISVGWLIVRDLYGHWRDATYAGWTNDLARFLSQSRSGGSTLVIVIVWAAVGYINKRARDFFIQFIGDVAAYISAHSVNKFCEIRRTIQQTALSVTQAVYAMKDDTGTLLYDRVVFLGHSLGSVIAYDMLNQMLLRDQLFPQSALHVHERTPTLLTFGSPLDKTAFIFREQQPLDAQVREALAAVHQPLIASYDYRPASWINIYSPADWISGPLDYYDEASEYRAEHPQFEHLRVKNEKDPDASVPLIAHTMYWSTPLFAQKLFAAVTQPHPGTPATT